MAKKHLMLDLETMDTSPDATVLTLGAVHFNPWGNGYGDKIYFRINIDDQDALGRKVDQGALDWWAKQDPAIMEEAFSPNDRIPFVEAIDKFHKFAWGCDAFWSHGATFDLIIIENIYRQLGKPIPWQFWQLRDTRTLFDLGYDPEMPKGNLHNALEDAIRQSVGVQNIYRKLNIRPK
jgi:3' exoribonuclease, RNase T-like